MQDHPPTFDPPATTLAELGERVLARSRRLAEAMLRRTPGRRQLRLVNGDGEVIRTADVCGPRVRAPRRPRLVARRDTGGGGA